MEEERQKLCAELRSFCTTWPYAKVAADEIERLAAELDETRKQLTLIQVDRDDWKFGRRA